MLFVWLMTRVWSVNMSYLVLEVLQSEPPRLAPYPHTAGGVSGSTTMEVIIVVCLCCVVAVLSVCCHSSDVKKY